jgi:hypothetical protein
MLEIKKCFSKKMIIAVSTMVVIGVGVGIGGGAKYLNKSQKDFKSIKSSLSTEKTKVKEMVSLLKDAKQLIIDRDKTINDMKSWKDKKSFVVVNRGLLEANLKLYTSLSPIIQKLILDNVIETAKKYNINPIILYSLLHVESTMRFQIEHARVLIKINNKKKYVKAVGLGGIVWEWWGDKLIKEKIAFTRSDLFLPAVNIKAVGFVLNEMYKKELLKGTKSKDESMLRRYFGGNFKAYSDKIDIKVMSIVRPNLYRY